MAVKDYYKVLGVDKSATQDEIKSAYRKLAKQYHPDLHPDDKEAAEKFKEINEAYSVIGDPDKRGKYDRGEMDNDFGGAGYNPYGGGFSASGFDDLFNMFTGAFDFGGAAAVQLKQVATSPSMWNCPSWSRCSVAKKQSSSAESKSAKRAAAAEPRTTVASKLATNAMARVRYVKPIPVFSVNKPQSALATSVAVLVKSLPILARRVVVEA